jgi:hypothetical protein
MDPNLFRLDWDRLLEVLATIVVLSFILERALAPVFENRLFLNRCDQKGVKEFLAVGLSFLVCWQWSIDALSMIVLTDKVTLVGELITAGVIAGGSKASLKLFRDVMGIRSSAYEKLHPSPQSNSGSPAPAATAQSAGK